jgi:hypothetical protein
VNIDNAGPSPLTKFRGRPFLIRDQNGLTRFYDNGPESYGYLVPDSRDDWEFRDAIRRFEFVDSIFQRVMLVPATISVFSMGVGDRYSDRIFAALSVSIAIIVIGRVLERNWYFGELVAGLTRIEPLDMAGRRKGNLFLVLIGIVYFSFVFWRILKSCGVS